MDNLKGKEYIQAFKNKYKNIKKELNKMDSATLMQVLEHIGIKASEKWDDEWIKIVILTAMDKGHPICGARKKSNGKPCVKGCINNGRCRTHGGNSGAVEGNTNALTVGLYAKKTINTLVSELLNDTDFVEQVEVLTTTDEQEVAKMIASFTAMFGMEAVARARQNEDAEINPRHLEQLTKIAKTFNDIGIAKKGQKIELQGELGIQQLMDSFDNKQESLQEKLNAKLGVGLPSFIKQKEEGEDDDE